MRRIFLAILLAVSATGAISVAAAQTTPPPPSDGSDGRGCDHEWKEPTTS